MGVFKKKTETRPEAVLQQGWQFYYRPTTLEPVGTVFRIDGQHTRYIVDTLNIPTSRGLEAAGRIEDRAEVGAGVLARLLGLDPKMDADAGLTEKVEFRLTSPEREISTDTAVDQVLSPFLDQLALRAGNRYFIIRECRWASAMTYRLSKERVMALGGEASIHQALKLGAQLRTINDRLYELDSTFEQAMRVMFLAEEIKPVSAGLGGSGPRLGRVPVREPLVWEPEHGTEPA